MFYWPIVACHYHMVRSLADVESGTHPTTLWLTAPSLHDCLLVRLVSRFTPVNLVWLAKLTEAFKSRWLPNTSFQVH